MTFTVSAGVYFKWKAHVWSCGIRAVRDHCWLRKAETPEAESNFGYPGTLEELLVVSVQFKGLLKVEVGGSQRDGEVDPSHVRQNGIFWQGLQSNTRVLQRNEIYTLLFCLSCIGNNTKMWLHIFTCVEEKPPKEFLCCESHLTTGRAEATSPRSV